LLCVSAGFTHENSSVRRKTIAIAAYAVVPALLVFIDSLISVPVYLDRTLIGACVLLPILLCIPIAFHAGAQRRFCKVLALVLLLATIVSMFGYLRRERREDWRSVTEYLLRLPEPNRRIVLTTDICQPLFNYYSENLFPRYQPVQVSGFLTKYRRWDSGFESSIFKGLREATPIASLATALRSGQYKEIDVVLQPAAPTSNEISNYLGAHCQSVSTVQFHWLEIRRCFTTVEAVSTSLPSDGRP
jgi:hypothetical protein